MNRKFFSGLLLLSLATGGVGTFTSCTDHEQDFQNKVLKGQKDLSDEIAAIRAFLGEPFAGSSLDERINAVTNARFEAVEDRLDEIEKDYATKGYVDQEITDAVNGVKSYIAETLEGYYTKDEIESKLGPIEKTANDAKTQADLNKAAIDKLEKALEEKADSKDLQDLKNEVYNIKKNQNNFDTQVQDLFKRYALVRSNQITSLIVERTYNPVFGTINLPIGLESNMLINYYAKPVEGVSFPSGWGENEGVETTFNYTLPISEADKFTLGTDEIQIEKFGDLYMTINPLERNFDGQKFQLVKSNGEALPAEFTANASDDILYLGYTRADNGLYKATIAPENGEDEALVNATEFKIESELKSAIKDVVKKHGKQDFLELAKAVYSQFNGKVPAYAAKVSWQEPVVDDVVPDSVGTLSADGKTVTKSVISGYDLAVATFYPLSYTTNPLDEIGGSIDKHLPVIGSLQERFDHVFNYIHDQLYLNLGTIKVNNVKINLSGVNVNVKADDIVISLEGQKMYTTDENGKEVVAGTFGKDAVITLTVNKDGQVDNPNAGSLKPLVDAIQNAIDEMLKGTGEGSLSYEIEKQLNDQVQDIVKQVNDEMSKVQTKIYDSLASIQNRVDQELNGTLGSAAQSLVDLYDAFAKRVNKFLDDPSYYMQSVMAYEAVDGGIYHLSTNPDDPTKVDKGAIKFFMTSYNAELIVPAFKKYVAIIKAGDATADAALNSNAGNDLNKVLSGRQQTLGFNTAALESGKTYEIFYQTLDFRGHTSTHVYYIYVNVN